MAASNSCVSTEFECAICSEQLKQPKYIGPCNHTLCKDCIKQYWISLGRKSTLPCPECRQKCLIPPNGVEGLKDNFKLSNIIEKYCNQHQTISNLVDVRCILCSNNAYTFCKECDLKLCLRCKGQHDLDPRTCDHDLFGLCQPHGNAKLFFCKPCKEAVCSGCRISKHNQGDHDVVPILLVVSDIKARIQAASNQLEVVLRTQTGEKEIRKRLSQLRDIVRQRSKLAEVHATAEKESIIAVKKNEIRDLNAESKSIQAKIRILMQKKGTVDERAKQLVIEVDKLEKEKTKIVAGVREKFTKPFEDIDEHFRSLDTGRQEMKTHLAQGRAVRSAKIVIDTDSIVMLNSIRDEILDLVRLSRKSDTKAMTEEFRRSMNELRLDVGVTGQGLPVMIRGQQVIKRDSTQRVIYRQLEKVNDVFFLGPLQPRTILHKMQHLPDGHLATLGQSSCSLDWADTLHFYNAVSSTPTGKIDKGVDPATDMAVSSASDLVVARVTKPPIRIFNRLTGAFLNISILHDGKEINGVGHVETDEFDNMFVLTLGSNPLILVVNPEGNVLQNVQFDGEVRNQAFCPQSSILYVVSDSRIRRIHWNKYDLREISTFPVGVAGVTCWDVCIGSGGEVFVSGWIKNDDDDDEDGEKDGGDKDGDDDDGDKDGGDDEVGDDDGGECEDCEKIMEGGKDHVKDDDEERDRDDDDDNLGNDYDIVIYQVTGEDKEGWTWRKIEYKDNVARRSYYGGLICTNGNNFWLGYDGALEKFKLLPEDNVQ